jgi:hypothetical protein
MQLPNYKPLSWGRQEKRELAQGLLLGVCMPSSAKCTRWYGQLKLQTTKSSWSAACHFNKCLLPQINLHAWLLDYPRRQSSFNGELKNIMIKSLPFHHLAKKEKEKENDFIYSN